MSDTSVVTASVDLETLDVTAASARGEPIRMSSDPPFGSGTSVEPKHLVLVALAGCSGVDVGSILRKKRQRPTSYEIAVSGVAGEEHPRVYTSIDVEHRVQGDVSPEALRRSIELSATTYCPVNAMLSAVARVEHRYLLLDASGATHAATVAVIGPDRQIRVMS